MATAAPRASGRTARPVGLADAVKSGRLDGLRALRDTLAAEIAAGPQNEKQVSPTATLARQLRETLREIAELERAQPKGSVVDDLAAKRTARGARPKGVGGAARAGVKRGS